MASTPYCIAFLTAIHGKLHGLTAVLDAIRRDAPDLGLIDRAACGSRES